MKKVYALLFSILFLSNLSAQVGPEDGTPSEEDMNPAGVAVTPSTVWMSGKPGTKTNQEVKVKNDSKKLMKFSISFNDFQMNEAGKVEFLEAGEGEYSLSKWINVSPTFFELEPGEKQIINVTVDVPSSEKGEQAAWTIMMVDEVKDRQPLDAEPGPDEMAFGIIPSFGIGVYLFQNPPNVAVSETEIMDMRLTDREVAESDGEMQKILNMQVKNHGDGISYCKTYMELTNYKTGEQSRMSKRSFVVLPKFTRSFSHGLPENLPSGDYSLMVVLDFGSEEEVEAAEIEFSIP